MTQNERMLFKLGFLEAVHARLPARDLHVVLSVFNKRVKHIELYFYGSTAELAADAGVSLRTLQHIFGRLEKHSLLEVDRQYGPGRHMGFRFILPPARSKAALSSSSEADVSLQSDFN